MCQVRYTCEDSGQRRNLKLKWSDFDCYVRVRVINYKSINSMDWNSANTRYISRCTVRKKGFFMVRSRPRSLNLFARSMIESFITSNWETDIDVKIEILRKREINFFLFLYLYSLYSLFSLLSLFSTCNLQIMQGILWIFLRNQFLTLIIFNTSVMVIMQNYDDNAKC